MAINKKLIHFQTLANFEAQLSAGNILDTSICFIKDANKIWTHGQFYDCDVQIMNDGGEGRVVLGHNNQTIYPYTLASQVQAGSSDLDTYLNNLADVATSGSYNDLKNKPTIPSAVTESTVSGWGFTKNTGTYSKPSTGIPKTDLASAVQTSLGKADTALQSYTEQYKGTVTGVKINGTTKNPSSGVVDLGTVITTHQTLKTINGESIVGSGDITISGGSSNANVQAVDTGDVLDDVNIEYATKAYFDSVVGDINSVLESIIGGSSGGSSSGGSRAYAYVNHGTSDTTFELTPNTFHVWEEVTSLNITLGAETSGIANEYLFQFISGSTPTTLTLPSDIKFSEDLVIESNKVYQISILKGLGSVLSWDSGVALIENKATYNNGTVTFQYPVASDLSIAVGSDTINISEGEQSCTLKLAEPGAEIRRITPISDSTYYYTF